MTYSFRVMLAAAALLCTTTARAQSRSVADVVLLPQAQIELGLKNNDYVLAAFSAATPNSKGRFWPYGAGMLRLGYEHFWNQHWSAGATLRLAFANQEGYGDFFGLAGTLTPGLLLRHTGKIGSLRFGQRLGLEYATTYDFLNSSNTYYDRGYTRLRLDLEREYKVGENLTLRPRLAYEIAAYLRLQREEGETKERVIDFGHLRAEVGVRLSPHFDLTPWVASQTRYINSLPQFDKTGKQVGGGRTNLITPTVGLDLRLTLLSKSTGSDRQQLPTQH